MTSRIIGKYFKIKYIDKIEANQENEIPHHIVEIDFSGDDFYEILNQYGSIPLPPYIQRKAQDEDKKNYQTVFAKEIGSTASPTAGLHFSKKLLDEGYLTIGFRALTGTGILDAKKDGEKFSKIYKENFNDKLGKWLAFGNELDTSKMRDLTKEEEENCSKALYKISEGTGIKLYED